jgi:hypothetical protein
MNKKTWLALLLFIVFSISGLIIYHNHAEAANDGPGCNGVTGAPFNMQYCLGYFTGHQDSTYASARDILPSGINVSNVSGIISYVESYLNESDPTGNNMCSSANGSFRPTQCEAGAAFIIETMLGHTGPTGGVANGVQDARNDLGTWINLVNSYANSPPAGYGIIWGTQSVCPGDLNSGFFTDMNDDAFHNTTCPLDDTPEITFYWPGGQFAIGAWCGNVETTSNQISKVPNPWGNISVSCNNSTSQYTAIVSFGDNNGITSGITGTVATGASPNNFSQNITGPVNNDNVPLPLWPTTNPYNSQAVTLTVSDNGVQYQTSTSTPAPCVTLGCSISTAPAYIDPYMTFSATVNLVYPSGPPIPTFNVNLGVTSPTGASIYNQNLSNGGTATVKFNPIGPTNGVGVYTAKATFGAYNGTCTDQITVVYMPYLQVFGGDVFAGSSPTSATGQCSPTQSAGVFSWNNYTTDFSGAGAQYAVQAMAQIEGFASSQNTSPSTAQLSFANSGVSGVSSSTNLFGGTYGVAANDCDFTSDIASDPNATTIKNSNKTISAETIPETSGGPDILYVIDHNVYISGNISYSPTSWTSVSQIPDYELIVVGGNITIGSNVTQLDGLYVAEPDTKNPNSGVIADCGNNQGQSVYNPTTDATFYSDCNNPLVINGAFVAQYVQFLRTNGTVGQAKSGDSVSSNHAAEVFNYTPELWLPRGGSNPSSNYDAISGLPPVL